MIMSRAAKIKLITLDIVTAVIDNVSESIEQSGTPENVKDVLEKLKEARECCFRLIAPTGRLELEPKDYESYKAGLGAAYAIIKETWKSTCPAEALIMVGLDMIERVRDHMKKNRQWNNLIDVYFDLYKLYDPELKGDHIDEGEAVSTRILEMLRR